jgi:hypothetical protein
MSFSSARPFAGWGQETGAGETATPSAAGYWNQAASLFDTSREGLRVPRAGQGVYSGIHSCVLAAAPRPTPPGTITNRGAPRVARRRHPDAPLMRRLK